MSPSVLSGRNHPNDCGCCAGTAAETPRCVDNRPGLYGDLAYRAGTHRAVQGNHAGGACPAQATRRCRDLQAPATTTISPSRCSMLGRGRGRALTFYQERLANESFLRTATERRSLLELAR